MHHTPAIRNGSNGWGVSPPDTRPPVPEFPRRFPPLRLSRYSLITILAATFLALATMYAPQPLLPLFAQTFGVSEADAAALITWSLLPMGLAPLGMGLLMQRIAPRRLLAIGLLLLGLTEIAFALVDVFAVLSALRFVQGALVAALLAATMTYIAGNARRMQHVMSYFVAASVIGGLSGRISAGFLASAISLQAGFLYIGVGVLAAAGMAWFLPAGPPPPRQTIRLARLFAALKEPGFVRLYGVMFALFFVFTAILNFIPFRLRHLDASLSSGIVGLSYSGFLLGMTASLLAVPIARRIGGELRAVVLGGVMLAGGIALASVAAVPFVVASVFATSAGLFLAHAVLAGYVNTLAGTEAASVSSLYVAFYYTGGTIGSYVPGLLYEQAGWQAFIGLLLTFTLGGLALTGWAMRARVGVEGV